MDKLKFTNLITNNKGEEMSVTNQKFIEDLAEFEYRFRDGLVFTAEQKAEIMAICQQIILIAGE